MTDEKDAVEELGQLFSAGDAWLRKHGMVTSIQHNSIVSNLYVNFPKVRYLEYFLPEDGTNRKVWVRLYVPFWKLLFLNRERMVDDVIGFLREYLVDYDIKVELKRYKKDVEKSNEVPNDAIDHVSAPVELQPGEGSSATGDSVPVTAPSEARGDDPQGTQPGSSGAGDEPSIPNSSDPGNLKPSV